jgi:phosphatidylglycerophosphatase A
LKEKIEKRPASGVADYIALSLTTFGVGYIPGAPGTYGSAVGVGIYICAVKAFGSLRYGGTLASSESLVAAVHAAILIALALFCLLGIWASDRSIRLLGNSDPSEAVVDEVMGQLIVFLFIPFTASWVLIAAGFFLFRLFDIWKPYPVRTLEILPGGLGICADDIVAGMYAGICLAAVNAIYLSV